MRPYLRKTRRITVLKRSYYRPGLRSGGHWTTEIKVVRDKTDKQLEKLLRTINKRLISHLWEIIGDYNMKRKADQKAYFQYCISCFYDPYSYDRTSSEIGHKTVKALEDNFDYLKGSDYDVQEKWVTNQMFL